MSIFSKLFKGGGRGDEPPTDPAHATGEADEDEDETTVVDGPAIEPASKRAGEKEPTPTIPQTPAPAERERPPPRLPPAPAAAGSQGNDGWRDLKAPTPPLRAKSRGGAVREVEPTPTPRGTRREPSGGTPRDGVRAPSKVLYAGTPFEQVVKESERPPAAPTGTSAKPGVDAGAKLPPMTRTPKTTPRPTPRTRPMAKPPMPERDPATEPSVTPEKLAEDVDAELDAIFEDVTGALSSAAAKQTPSERVRAEKRDAEAARAMFLEVSAVHLRQAREALLALRQGEDARAFIGPAIASIQVVHEAARKIGEQAMGNALEALLAQLRAADEAGGVVAADARDAIVAAWSKLPLPPEQLDLEAEHVRREALIVRSLLMQVPNLEKLGVEKMFAAGLGNLPTLLSASADDIAATTGLEHAVSAGVVERTAEYVRDFGTTVARIDRAGTRTVLEALLRTLRHEQEAFDRAAAQWTDESFTEKRRRRAERARVLLQIDVVLALLGEIDRARALERLPVHRRIERLETFVKDTAAFGAAPA